MQTQCDPIMPSYFKKNVLSTKLKLSNGEVVPWDKVGVNTGILETEDAQIIKELNDYIARKVGGVSVIDAATYASLKKNPARRLVPQFKAVASATMDALQPLAVPSPASSVAPDVAPSKPAKPARAEKPTVSKGVFEKNE